MKPISPGASYNRVGYTQCVIIEDGDYTWFFPLPERKDMNRYSMKVATASLKSVTYETIDAA